MHKLRIDPDGFSPGATDHLIESIYSFLKDEPDEIYLEIVRPYARTLRIPVSPDSTGQSRFIEIPLRQILYAVSDRHYCEIRTTHGTRRFRIPFREIRCKLPDDLFLTCNRGVILSMPHIREQTGDFFIMSDEARFSLHIRNKKEIIRQYERFRSSCG